MKILLVQFVCNSIFKSNFNLTLKINDSWIDLSLWDELYNYDGHSIGSVSTVQPMELDRARRVRVWSGDTSAKEAHLWLSLGSSHQTRQLRVRWQG